MLRKEQIEYALHYAENPVEWVFELVHGLEKRIDELLKFGTKVTVFQEHWHPASELPVVPEHYNWISVVAIVCDMDDNSTRATNATFNKDKGWIFPEFSRVLWWCYPPKED